MRPNAIVNFERLFLVSIVIATVQLALEASQQIGSAGPVTQFVVVAAIILISVLLVLFVSRRRSNIARWVLTVLTAAGFAVAIHDLATGLTQDVPGAIGFGATLLQVAAVALLFTRGARDWFARRT